MSIVIFSALLVIPSQANEWKRDDLGWWFVPTEGGYFKSSWNNISEKWYYFDDRGYMAENRWIGEYYVGADGAMLTDATTPDGIRVGADGKREESFTSAEVTAYQKKAMETIVKAYISRFAEVDIESSQYIGSDNVIRLKSAYKMREDTLIDIMSYFAQGGAYYLLPRENVGSLSYMDSWSDGMGSDRAYNILELVALVEGLTGRYLPSNYRDLLFVKGHGMSKDYIGPIQASGAAGYEVFADEIRLQDGRIHIYGHYIYGWGLDSETRGKIEAVFKKNSKSKIGMTLDTVTVYIR